MYIVQGLQEVVLINEGRPGGSAAFIWTLPPRRPIRKVSAYGDSVAIMRAITLVVEYRRAFPPILYRQLTRYAPYQLRNT